MKIKFIINPLPSERKSTEIEREIVKFRKELKLKRVKIEKSFTAPDGRNTAQNLAKKATEEGFNQIIFVGGDGTLNEGVNGIMQVAKEKFPKDLTIGIIPAGTGNDFALALNIPRNVQKAFRVIKEGKTKSVDMGKANERYFVNCFSVGFDAKINKVANEFKQKYKFLPKEEGYLFAALLMIIAKIPKFEIQIQGKDINYQNKILLATITNSKTYGGGFLINPGAKIDDGIFNMCAIEPVGKIRAIFDLYYVSKGAHTHLPEIKTFHFDAPLTISSPTYLPCETDGEVLEPKKEYKIKILPKTLRILIP